MDLHSALLIPAIYACVAAAAVGVLLRLIARFARRVGDVLHCAGCDYALTGITSQRCPECGRELTPRNVVKGLRPPRRALRVAGLVLEVGGLLALVPIAYLRLNLVDWYLYRSNENVIDDAASLDKATADRAWAELDRRLLSTEAEQKLIAVALDEFAKPRGPTRGPNWQRLVDHLGKQYEADALTPAQARRFLEQIYRVELLVRPTVALGDAAVYRFEATAEAPNSLSDGWTAWATCLELLLDGEVVAGSQGKTVSSSRTRPGRVPVLKAGVHQLSARCRIRLWRGNAPPDRTKEIPILDRFVELHCPFTVVDRPASEMIAILDTPGLEPVMRSAILVSEIDWRGVEIQLAMLPEHVAFEVIILVGKEEKSLGTLIAQRGDDGWRPVVANDLQKLEADTVDIVLRPSPEAARGTIEMTRIWGREMVFKAIKVNHTPEPPDGIPIPPRPSAPQPEQP